MLFLCPSTSSLLTCAAGNPRQVPEQMLATREGVIVTGVLGRGSYEKRQKSEFAKFWGRTVAAAAAAVVEEAEVWEAKAVQAA